MNRRQAPTSQPQPADRPTGGLLRKRILLADDDPTVRESVGAVLAGEGYSVVTAANGAEAVTLAMRNEFDLVVLDLHMPVKNGWDAFEELTRQRPLLPVVIATARPNQLFTALGAGVAALLEKPLNIPDLLQTIQRVLNEPAQTHLARLAGRETDFYYSPGKAKGQTGI